MRQRNGDGVILVLTNSEDGIHSDIVISKLLAIGEEVFRFDSDRFTSGDISVSFLFPDDKETKFSIIFGDEHVCSSEIKSVWYRRPNYFKFSIDDFVQRSYAEREVVNFLEGLWRIIEDKVFWLSKSRSLENARKKMYQLELASRLGLLVPRTIVTNNPGEVIRFYRECNSKIVCKAIYHEFLDYGDKAFNIQTTLVTDRHLERIELVKVMPSLFQEYIDKAYELRVTIVGDRLFPVKIDSQNNPLTIVDWRNPACINNLEYSSIKLGRELESTCLEMLDILDLQFGAFDFVVGKNGKTYFLEVNPNGQWYWIENITGMLISDAIVDLLRKGGDGGEC